MQRTAEICCGNGEVLLHFLPQIGEFNAVRNSLKNPTEKYLHKKKSAVTMTAKADMIVLFAIEAVFHFLSVVVQKVWLQLFIKFL